VGLPELESGTSVLSGQRSNQLSYKPLRIAAVVPNLSGVRNLLLTDFTIKYPVISDGINIVKLKGWQKGLLFFIKEKHIKKTLEAKNSSLERR
jgi:hypothetical protein